MKFNKFVMGLIVVSLFIVTACNNSEPIISEEQAKSIVLDYHTGNNGEVKIISVNYENDGFIVKWEIEENCESGTDIVNDKNGEIKSGQTSIC